MVALACVERGGADTPPHLRWEPALFACGRSDGSTHHRECRGVLLCHSQTSGSVAPLKASRLRCRLYQMLLDAGSPCRLDILRVPIAGQSEEPRNSPVPHDVQIGTATGHRGQ